ncbi:unnamed protein product [Diatraea saccharalis]|uniref:Uncharacterized protein n=1 Tax=Diatraea saccharalis TaxID=40085 RepID=A0A9N9RBK8_9NEOP|nr:unnamed protein product [Diatraea saccharalis]
MTTNAILTTKPLSTVMSELTESRETKYTDIIVTESTITTVEPKKITSTETEKLPFHTCGCATANTISTTESTTTTKFIEPTAETTLESTTTTSTIITTEKPVTQTCGCATATNPMTQTFLSSEITTSNVTESNPSASQAIDTINVTKNLTESTKSMHFVTCGCATATALTTTIATTTTPVTSTTTTPATMTTTIPANTSITTTTPANITTTTSETLANTTKVTELVTTKVTEPTEGEQNSSVTCDGFPKDCNRPSTWETTSEGETRDFFQILKARYGRRAMLLADTTHWPTRLGFFIKKNTGNKFIFGNHNEIRK